MKNSTYIGYILFVLVSCSNFSEEKTLKIESIIQENDNPKIDSLKASKSKAVIEGRLLNFEGGDKYYYSTIRVENVLLNKTKHNIGDTMRVAYYNWGTGIPKDKKCIIYIVPWSTESDTPNKNWLLIEGDGKDACECK